ncbi:M23 family metallopeptidase (plasmid) [Neobacillus sp. SCS-31]|uniref:M23 family metallopeptidase n=1 Tax=Neobacillus oceani TaxID=3115292 RepID=UPI003906BA61
MILRITSKFGEVSSIHKTPHTGIDIALPENSPIKAITEGVVDRIYTGTGSIGKGLSIQMEDGTRAIYGHMNDVSVKVGERIEPGEIIGLTGNTGNSTGPHLHFGLKANDGSFLDPSPLLNKIIENGKVGQIPQFNIWEWLGEKFTEITVGRVADFIADFALAFPIIAVVSFGVYALLGICSKTVAKWGALGTVLYGILSLI